MSDTQKGAWFYTREGERLGPVSFADLRIKAAEGGLNPRLDMAWTQGMGEWKPAGEIEGLFERRTTSETRESLAPSADPYRAPALEPVPGLMGKDDGWPGARRRSYLFVIFIFPFLLNLGMAMAAQLLKDQFGPEIGGWILLGCVALQVVLVIYYGIQRFPNLGMSRWWYLGHFIPFLNIWLNYRCFACPAGYAYHKKLDGIGIFLALIYWLSVLVVILLVVAFVALLFGAIGSPETQDQVREAVRKITEATRAATEPKP